MKIFVLLPLLIVLGSCSKPSLEDSIVDKVITFELKGKGQAQIMFNANGVMLVGPAGNLQDDGLTYKIDGNEVLVFDDGERDGGILFSSASPKVGDQVEMGAENEKQKRAILKIEQPAAIPNEKARQNQNLAWLKGLQVALYSKFGKFGYLPDPPLEEIIIAAARNDEVTRLKNPESGETRQVLYNLLTDFGPRHIMLASPWVQGGERAVVYGDGRGELIDEEKYQQEIQKEAVEMRSLK